MMYLTVNKNAGIGRNTKKSSMQSSGLGVDLARSSATLRKLTLPLLPGFNSNKNDFHARRQSVLVSSISSPTIDELSKTALKDGNDKAQVVWKCSIYSTSKLSKDTSSGLIIKVIDKETGKRSHRCKVDDWRPAKPIVGNYITQGWERVGPIELPSSFESPCAVLILKEPNSGSLQDYITSITLTSAHGFFNIRADSWVSSDQGWRVFFEGTAYLPKDTPMSLKDKRGEDLEVHQGTSETRMQMRKGADRVYWYQVYNDLSSGKEGKLVRPNLGGSKKLPYPRRLATNRGNDQNGQENPAQDNKIWLPLDDQFGDDKDKDFSAGTNLGKLQAALSFIAVEADKERECVITQLLTKAIEVLGAKIFPFLESPLTNFEDFEDVRRMFFKASYSEFTTKMHPVDSQDSTSVLSSRDSTSVLSSRDSTSVLSSRDSTSVLSSRDSISTRWSIPSRFKTADGAWDFQRLRKDGLLSKFMDGWSFITGVSSVITTGNMLYSPGEVPRVLDGRQDAWHRDEEFGRQAIAGFNPCVIQALTSLPESFGSAIRGEHISADLQGSSLEKLVAEAAAGAKPRLYYIDYWDMSAFWGEAEGNTGGSTMVQHAARVVLYLQTDADGKDVGLIPVAIELAHPHTHRDHPELPQTAGVVYSRSRLSHSSTGKPLWLLAKMIFKSIDSAFHQLISHWNRTHCVLEPFYIAMRRQISIMHPVYKLMMPHFRYTLNINANARSSLINSNGVIETSFSAGPYCMRLASVVYGKSWNFTTEALPEDLKARGMVDSSGKPWLDYPYAEDGMDMWNELTTYFHNYLQLYYKSDAEVMSDHELQNWWKEVKEEGHPDLLQFGLRPGGEHQLWGFSGPIRSVSKLVHVLTTIAWLASGHHAAVNFGQYDYTSFVLNASSLVRRPMPAPGECSYKELTSVFTNKRAQERIIMKYMADPITALKIASTVMLLSTHARDEQTLDEVNELLMDSEACKENRRFVEKMRILEEKIEQRNADITKWARCSLPKSHDERLSPSKIPLPYTLLVPNSRPGITMRGVPYSVSI